MLYAKVVVGLPVSGPFDYIVPEAIAGKICVGSRCRVNFGTRRIIGYCVGLAKKSAIKNLKPILELIDEYPLLNKNMLLLTRELADYYCCSWGEAIETAIPDGLRKGRKIDAQVTAGDTLLRRVSPAVKEVSTTVLIHDLDGRARWDIYISEIKKALENNLSSIIILPDIPEVLRLSKMINQQLGITVHILYRKQALELKEWVEMRLSVARVVVGTRSAVFAPLDNLGLIIIEDEENSVYKQDQVPHYNAREAGFMRARLDKVKLILGSRSPALESYLLSQKHKIQYIPIPRKDFPEIKIIDTRRLPFQERKERIVLARSLEDAIYTVLNEKGKTLLFLNRKGFATSAACHNCGKPIKCPRCNINLAFHFKDNLLSCHYCNFKQQLPEICPECNAGYIKFSGAGIEKIESELSRIFPQARIKILDEKNTGIEDADICIATSSVIKQADFSFDLIGVLGIDNSLNRVDFRATEKVFGLLYGLLALTRKKIFIQTGTPTHHCFQALLKKDAGFFYKEELAQRKQLGFPPYSRIILVKLRGNAEEKVKQSAETLFNKLKEDNKDKHIEIISVNPANPLKLRGNFYWQVLIRSDKAPRASAFLKNSLKDFRHSGIIVTVDVDPV